MDRADSPTDRFRELILYVSRKTEDDPRCGATKLNKILFYADFLAYRKLGEPISGQRYQKLAFGPAPRALVPTIEAMMEGEDCVWVERDYFGRPQKKLVARREPDLSYFTAEEIHLVDEVVEELWEQSATEVSDLSHRFPGWQAAEPGEDIPYETVFVGEPLPLSADEAAWANDVIEEYLAAGPAGP